MPAERTLLERLDFAERELREAMVRELPTFVINALSALCAAAAARCMVSVEEVPDAD
jgi:hypothetical protein